MNLTDRTGIIIYGLKHSGKTLLSKGLARFFSLPLFDLDELLAQELCAETFASLDHTEVLSRIRQFYKEKGQAAFQELEAKTFGNFLALQRSKENSNYVLALGGGSLDNPDLSALLPSEALLVFLDVPEKVLFERIIRGGIPAFLDPQDPAESFSKMYKRRREIALKTCKICVDLGTLGPDEALEKLKFTIQEYDNGRK